MLASRYTVLVDPICWKEVVNRLSVRPQKRCVEHADYIVADLRSGDCEADTIVDAAS